MTTTDEQYVADENRKVNERRKFSKVDYWRGSVARLIAEIGQELPESESWELSGPLLQVIDKLDRRLRSMPNPGWQ